MREVRGVACLSLQRERQAWGDRGLRGLRLTEMLLEYDFE
jgi:hypothetical protein